MRLPDLSLDAFRRQLASVDALPQLCVLGVVTGLITGSLMVVFRLALMVGAMLVMPYDDPEAFEQLSTGLRMVLPIIAVTVIGVLLWRQPLAARKIGVSHVIERLTYHQGRFPLRNWLNQWWVGVVSKDWPPRTMMAPSWGSGARKAKQSVLFCLSVWWHGRV